MLRKQATRSNLTTFFPLSRMPETTLGPRLFQEHPETFGTITDILHWPSVWGNKFLCTFQHTFWGASWPCLKIPGFSPQQPNLGYKHGGGLPSLLCPLEMVSTQKIGTFCESQGWWVHFEVQLVPGKQLQLGAMTGAVTRLFSDSL